MECRGEGGIYIVTGRDRERERDVGGRGREGGGRGRERDTEGRETGGGVDGERERGG